MSDKTRWTNKRRTFLKGAGVTATVGLAGCLGGGDEGNGNGNGGNGNGNGNGSETGNGNGNGDTDENIVRFVLNPAEADVSIEEQYQPMFEYIEEEAGVTVEPVVTDSYAATLTALRDDQADVADTSPSAAVAGKDVADVIGIRVAYGAAQYFSTITTTPDSGIEELADLEGEVINAGSILSVSGTLVPLTMLQDAGLDIGNAPDGDPVDFDIGYEDHATARNQLINRPDVTAAMTGAFVSAPLVPQEQFDEYSDFVDISAEYENAGSDIGAEDADPNDELKLLAVSDPIPRAPLMVRSAWEADVRSDVEEAILNVSEEDLQHDDDYDGEPIWFTGVQEGSIDDYEPIQTVLDELGLEFEDIE